MSLVWQSVFPESRMISKILPENGFPRQCAHWLGMTLYLRFVYNLKTTFSGRWFFDAQLFFFRSFSSAGMSGTIQSAPAASSSPSAA